MGDQIPSVAEFMQRLPRIFPEGGDPQDPNIDGRAAQDLVQLLVDDFSHAPHVNTFLRIHRGQFLSHPGHNQLLEILTRGVGALNQPAIPMPREPVPLMAASAPALIDTVLALLQERDAVKSVEDESDHSYEDREFLSGSVLDQISAATGMGMGISMGISIRMPYLNVTDLRHDSVKGIYSQLTGNPVEGFARGRRKKAETFFRLDADRVYNKHFPWLQSIQINRDSILFILDRPMDVSKLFDLFEYQQPDFTFSWESAEKGSFKISDGDNVLVRISPYAIAVPYRGHLLNEARLSRAIHLGTRIVESIHHDRMISSAYQVVDLTEFRPVADAFLGNEPITQFTQVGQFVTGNLNKLTDRGWNIFVETRSSFRQRSSAYRKGLRGADLPPAIYKLKEEAHEYPPYTRYVLVEDGPKKKMILGFNVNLQSDAFEKLVTEALDDVSIEEELAEGVWKQKGSRKGRTRREWKVYRGDGEDKRMILKLSLLSAEIPMTENTEDFALATRILDMMHQAGTFITGTINVGKIRAGLTEEERSVLPAWNYLRSLVNFFVRITLQKQQAEDLLSPRGAVPSVPTSHVWVADAIKESAAETVEERLLYVLKKIHGMVDEKNLRVFGSDAEVRYFNLSERIQSIEVLLGEQPTGGGSPQIDQVRAYMSDHAVSDWKVKARQGDRESLQELTATAKTNQRALDAIFELAEAEVEGAVEALAELAPSDPWAASYLHVLVTEDNEVAREALVNLDVSHLIERAKTDPTTLAVLEEIAEFNEAAHEAFESGLLAGMLASLDQDAVDDAGSETVAGGGGGGGLGIRSIGPSLDPAEVSLFANFTDRPSQVRILEGQTFDPNRFVAMDQGAQFGIHSGSEIRQQEADEIRVGAIEFTDDGGPAVVLDPETVGGASLPRTLEVSSPNQLGTMDHGPLTMTSDQETILLESIALAEKRGLTEVVYYLEFASDKEVVELFTDENALYRNLIENGYAELVSQLSQTGQKVSPHQIVMLNAALVTGSSAEVAQLVEEISPAEVPTEMPGMTVLGAPTGSSVLRTTSVLRVVR